MRLTMRNSVRSARASLCVRVAALPGIPVEHGENLLGILFADTEHFEGIAKHAASPHAPSEGRGRDRRGVSLR